jgi:hypothetical protein
LKILWGSIFAKSKNIKNYYIWVFLAPCWDLARPRMQVWGWSGREKEWEAWARLEKINPTTPIGWWSSARILDLARNLAGWKMLIFVRILFFFSLG